jgi:anion-transporting  ArsA/GET3 family ATPase
VTAKLHVLLGAGGVGKTTLAAGYALALAHAGGRVGLLGIDPARRLQTALGIQLTDVETKVACAGELHAALLGPAESMRRWAAEASPDAEARERLLKNTFFLALAERLAAANDVLAAIRLAEWVERDPDLTDLVVDTAPGLNAIEFLRRPESLAAFLEGPLVAWLRRLARAEHGTLGGVVRGAALRVLGGLSRIGGMGMLVELGDFLALGEATLERMAVRLAEAQRWIRSGPTEILLVTAVRDDAATAAAQIAAALAKLGLAPRAALVNHALPASFGDEISALAGEPLGAEASAVLRYARAQAALQARELEAAARLAPAVIALPAARGLDGEHRLAVLASLGERLREDLNRG